MSILSDDQIKLIRKSREQGGTKWMRVLLIP
jgi:hypothetical protein